MQFPPFVFVRLTTLVLSVEGHDLSEPLRHQYYDNFSQPKH